MLDLLHRVVELEGMGERLAKVLPALIREHPLQRYPVRVVGGQHPVVHEIDGHHRHLAKVVPRRDLMDTAFAKESGRGAP